MTSLQKERQAFIAAVNKEGVPEHVALLVLRDAGTIQRLAAAECNGDYPCDNGERKVKDCSVCEAGYARSALSIKGVCPGCRAEARIAKRLVPFGVVPDFQGDPRGACVKLKVPSGRTDDWGRTGICVPTREF